jgi:hypothetical protein
MGTASIVGFLGVNLLLKEWTNLGEEGSGFFKNEAMRGEKTARETRPDSP